MARLPRRSNSSRRNRPPGTFATPDWPTLTIPFGQSGPIRRRRINANPQERPLPLTPSAKILRVVLSMKFNPLAGPRCSFPSHNSNHEVTTISSPMRELGISSLSDQTSCEVRRDTRRWHQEKQGLMALIKGRSPDRRLSIQRARLCGPTRASFCTR
jgi:hypothetical protein